MHNKWYLKGVLHFSFSLKSNYQVMMILFLMSVLGRRASPPEFTGWSPNWSPNRTLGDKAFGKVNACVLSGFSRVRLFVSLWTAACQALLSMGFSGQGYWSGLPCPPPRDLPNPGIEPRSPALQVASLRSGPPRKFSIIRHFHYSELWSEGQDWFRG